jgi:hypothetical protein
MEIKGKENTAFNNEDQNRIRKKYYRKAMRRMGYAKEYLTLANRIGSFYEYPSYVTKACGAAYGALLAALKGYAFIIGYPIQEMKKEKSSIDYYRGMFEGNDPIALSELNSAHNILQSGYYDGNQEVSVLKEGFDAAYSIIKKIKPIV